MTLCERIKKVRKELDLTQQEFGKKIGMKQNTIALIEGGRGTSDQTIFAICREFNVNEAWLRTGEGEMFINRSRDEELAAFVNELLSEKSTGFRRRLVTALSRLNPEQWDALEAVALELTKEPSVLPSAPTPPPVEREPEPVAELTKQLAELRRQNQELAAEIAAMKEEDAALERAEKSAAQSRSR